MGSGGTEYETGDVFEQTRLNQKTRFVGTGEQATNLITAPQIGQQVFSTENDGSFHDNKLATYLSTSAWEYRKYVEHDEESVGSLTGEDTNSAANTRYYRFTTLPTDYKFYIITAFEYGSMNAAGASVYMGADIVDSATPAINGTSLVAWSRLDNPASDTTNYKLTNVTSKLIRGGTLLAYWI